MSKRRLGRIAVAIARLGQLGARFSCGSTGEKVAGSCAVRGRARLSIVSVLGLVILAAAACSNTPSAAPTTSSTSTSVAPTTSASPPSTDAPSTTSSSAASAVLTAYRAAGVAIEQAGANANPLDPALKASLVNPLLRTIEGNLIEDNQLGEVARGTIQLHPHVVSISASSAVVEDCSYSSDFLVYKKTGKQVPPVAKPENDGVRATLVLDGSTWKESQQTITEGSCPTGY
jgi:hypothetical protein